MSKPITPAGVFVAVLLALIVFTCLPLIFLMGIALAGTLATLAAAVVGLLAAYSAELAIWCGVGAALGTPIYIWWLLSSSEKAYKRKRASKLNLPKHLG